MIQNTLKLLYFFLICAACHSTSEEISTPEPNVKTEKTAHDTDDPAIWLNENDPAKSIIFGTDKDSDGAIVAFSLEGEILNEKTIGGVKRPNNVDIRKGFLLNDSSRIDLLAFTERERKQVRIFSVPDMEPLDFGGIPVFEDEEDSKFQYPMGISFYDPPNTEDLFLIVSRKNGPEEEYLYQYKVITKGAGLSLQLVRKFGNYSGQKEIEAIAVDDELGFVYYSDETFGIRKYHADPEMGDEELGVFGGETFAEDSEGIAIMKCSNGNGYIIVSNQQRGTFNFFDRKSNEFIKEMDLGTKDTDGIEILNVPLNEIFSTGLFVAMNNNKDFYFYDLKKLKISDLCQ